MAGARSVDPEIVNAARMLGASERKIFTTIVLPASVPNILQDYKLLFQAAGQLY